VPRLLTTLLRDTPAPIPASDVESWWRGFCGYRPELAGPIDRSVLAGFLADRLGFAFAGAYQAALRVLGPALPDRALVSFCVTEPGGNHPRAIATRLTPRSGGGFTLSGTKRWSTLAPLADALLVVASEGADAEGRKQLRLVKVDARAPGVTVTTMPAPPFMPEVPHGALALDGVEVERAAVLPGDAYQTHVKPFRTVEDVHVHAAVLGYVLSVARRHGFPREAVERLVAAVVAARALAALDPAAAETHVALAGFLAQQARVLGELAGAWVAVDGAERARWERDRVGLGSVAAQVRERRRERAWEMLDPGVSRP
jgi:acyl-CoA dehydrogenase